MADRPPTTDRYVGTIIGESTSREFRLALAHETVREQDLIVVEADLPDAARPGTVERVRVWAKVRQIERLNPLFPIEAGHELAATRTDPLDTVLSLSREMVTAVCQVLGAEVATGTGEVVLRPLRYPPRPATSAYRPTDEEIGRVISGGLRGAGARRALDLATLANRPEVTVLVDGHAVVTRHLAILAMTGAGKSWTARRLIEELAARHYPIVIFDPHGDYSGLAELPALRGRVRRYYARFPIFEEEGETVAKIVESLGYGMTDTMRTRFEDVFAAARAFYSDCPDDERAERIAWLGAYLGCQDQFERYGVGPDLWLVARIAEAGERALRLRDDATRQRLQEWGWAGFTGYSGTDSKTLEGIKKRTYTAARALTLMERTNRQVARGAEPLPTDRRQLVDYGRLSVIALAGYTSDFQATLFRIIAGDLFQARVEGQLAYPVLLVLEEAHTFAPGRPGTTAEERAVATARQIAQEGRKFGVGLLLISQRPSRLDETTLSQCNSFVIMRMVNPADQQFVQRVVETLGEADAQMLPDLDVGEALLSGQFVRFPVLVRIKPPQSQGEREEQDAFSCLEEIHRAQSRSHGLRPIAVAPSSGPGGGTAPGSEAVSRGPVRPARRSV